MTIDCQPKHYSPWRQAFFWDGTNFEEAEVFFETAYHRPEYHLDIGHLRRKGEHRYNLVFPYGDGCKLCCSQPNRLVAPPNTWIVPDRGQWYAFNDDVLDAYYTRRTEPDP